MDSNTRAILLQTKKAIDKAVDDAKKRRNEEDRKYIVAAIGQDLVKILTPLLNQIAANSRLTKQEISEIIKQIKVEAPQVSVGSPQIDVKSPVVNVPPIVFPKEAMIKAIREAFSGIQIKPPNVEVKPQNIKIPDKVEVKGIKGYFETLRKAFTGKLNVGLEEIDRDNPLHVVLVDDDGKYYKPGGAGIGVGAATGGGIVKVIEINLSSQCDGSTTIFNLGRVVKSIILININGTLAPYTLNTAKTQITLGFSPDTDEVLKAVAII